MGAECLLGACLKHCLEHAQSVLGEVLEACTTTIKIKSYTKAPCHGVILGGPACWF